MTIRRMVAESSTTSTFFCVRMHHPGRCALAAVPFGGKEWFTGRKWPVRGVLARRGPWGYGATSWNVTPSAFSTALRRDHSLGKRTRGAPLASWTRARP